MCSNLEPSDWIDIASAIINTGLAIWIVSVLQNKLTNKRMLKDFFISEIKAIQSRYCEILDRIHADSLDPIKITAEFKLLNIRVNNLMKYVSTRHQIAPAILKPFQQDLVTKITNNQDFINQYNSANPVTFSTSSKLEFFDFQRRHEQLFLYLIVKINDHK